MREKYLGQTFDRRTLLTYGVGGAASAVLLAAGSPSQAATTTFKAEMKGSTEVPPNTTPGTGTCTVTFDPATKQVTWEGTFSGLTGPATAAHIHGPGEPGKNAGVVVPLSQKDVPFTTPFKGSATLKDDAQASDLMAGLYYVNIHTEANKGGELRGQLMKS